MKFYHQITRESSKSVCYKIFLLSDIAQVYVLDMLVGKPDIPLYIFRMSRKGMVKTLTDYENKWNKNEKLNES